MKIKTALHGIFLTALGLWTAFIVGGLLLKPDGLSLGDGVILFLVTVAVPWLCYATLRQNFKRRQPTPPPPAEPSPSPPVSTKPKSPSPLFDLALFLPLCRGILADDKVTLEEAQTLERYLDEHGADQDSRVLHISVVVSLVLQDGQLDADEAEELRVLLSEFVDSIDKPTKKKPAKKPKKKTPPRAKPRTSTIDEDLAAGNRYFITYTDSRGSDTEREIHVLSIKTNKAGNRIVNARCKSANANRSFRLDRIVEAIDMSTGEVLS